MRSFWLTREHEVLEVVALAAEAEVSAGTAAAEAENEGGFDNEAAAGLHDFPAGSDSEADHLADYCYDNVTDRSLENVIV